MRALVTAAPRDARLGWDAAWTALKVCRQLGVLGLPPRPPAEEAHQRGWLHSLRRDSAAVGIRPVASVAAPTPRPNSAATSAPIAG